jgi:hypothetical protein
MAKVISYKKFDFSKINLGTPRESKNGSKTIRFEYPNHEEWYFQTPSSKVPFKPYDTNFCITVGEKLEAKIRELETKIIEHGITNSVSWFGSPKTEEEVKEIFVPILGKSKGDWPPFMRINFTDGCEIYNNEGELTTKEQVVMRSQMRVIIKFVKLYIKEKDGKPVMRCNIDSIQARLSKPLEVKPVSYAFIESDEES